MILVSKVMEGADIIARDLFLWDEGAITGQKIELKRKCFKGMMKYSFPNKCTE